MSDPHTFSVTLYTYNQENHVKKAVESILSQQCAALEIIISDDASTDSTFQIIKECVDCYTGPHKVILNRNEKNMGFRRHVNKIIAQSQGDWVIYAAGDDIFFPHRCAEIMKAAAAFPEALAIYSSWIDIDEQDNEKGRNPLSEEPYTLQTIDEILSGKNVWANGCAAAYSRRLLNMSDMPPGVQMDDLFYSLLAFLKGPILRINKNLLQFRTWSGSMTNQPASKRTTTAELRDKHKKRSRSKRVQKAIYLHCLRYAEKMSEEELPRKDEVIKELKKRIFKLKALGVWWKLNFRQRLALVLKLRRSPVYLLPLDIITAVSLKKRS